MADHYRLTGAGRPLTRLHDSSYDRHHRLKSSDEPKVIGRKDVSWSKLSVSDVTVTDWIIRA